jgi:aconitate hydratase
VEFFGPGVAQLSIADRATISNMVTSFTSHHSNPSLCFFYLSLNVLCSCQSPEMGATICYFPVDEKALEYMRLTGRTDEHIAYTKAYLQAQV